LRIDRLDRVGRGLPVIDRTGFQIESEPVEPLPEGPDVFLVTLFDFLRGDDPAGFLFEDDQATGCAARKEFINMPLRDWLLSVA